MTELSYGPKKDWRTFTLYTKGKKLRDFKSEWYKLYSKENPSSDVIVCFRSGEVKLCSSNIYWGSTKDASNFQYSVDGLAIGNIYSKIKSIDFMHHPWSHPDCAEFWNKDEYGVYSSFDYTRAKPVLDKLYAKLLAGAPNDRSKDKLSLADQIYSAESRCVGHSVSADKMLQADLSDR